MEKKDNWEQYRNELSRHNVQKLYHFTSRENIESIKKNGGLYSWAECVRRGIIVPKPGGSEDSHRIDRRKGLDEYVHLSFVKDHPMAYVAMGDRISYPYILEIDVEVAWWEGTLYSDRNAASSEARIGSGLGNLRSIDFEVLGAWKMFDLTEAQRPYYQAEVLVRDFIPMENIHIVDYINERGDRYSPDRLTFLKPAKYGDGNVKVDEGTEVIADSLCPNWGIDSIDFPDTVKKIGSHAFCQCSGLRQIKLPASLEKIGEMAFFNCHGVKQIVIPENVKEIGGGAFSGTIYDIICKSPHFKVQDGILYSSDMSRVISCFSNAKKIELPSSVRRIEPYAFNFSQELREVVLHDGVEYIGDRAFDFCPWLKKINLPSTLKEIGDGVFCACHWMGTIEIPDSVEHIGDCAFFDCERLETLRLPKNLTSLGGGLCAQCHLLEAFWFPESLSDLSHITNYFFYSTKLKAIYIPIGKATKYRERLSDYTSVLVEY